MLSSDNRMISGPMVLMIAGLAGLLTWLCSVWLGGQSLLTAMIVVVLVELLLASFGVIGILLTERMTLALLRAEKRVPKTAKPRTQHAPIWRRLLDYPPLAPAASDLLAMADHGTDTSTVPFPATEKEPGPESADRLRRAA